jgi:hypothetical protein
MRPNPRSAHSNLLARGKSGPCCSWWTAATTATAWIRRTPPPSRSRGSSPPLRPPRSSPTPGRLSAVRISHGQSFLCGILMQYYIGVQCAYSVRGCLANNDGGIAGLGSSRASTRTAGTATTRPRRWASSASARTSATSRSASVQCPGRQRHSDAALYI